MWICYREGLVEGFFFFEVRKKFMGMYDLFVSFVSREDSRGILSGIMLGYIGC